MFSEMEGNSGRHSINVRDDQGENALHHTIRGHAYCSGATTLKQW